MMHLLGVRALAFCCADKPVYIMKTMDDTLFNLRITAYTPETIPMSRLAEYMREFAALLGSEGQVHFDGLRKGSTVLRARVEHEDVPKVEGRVAKATHSDAPLDVVRSFNAINALLRADNARATLKRGTAQIIKFPGCDAPLPQRIGPIKEAGQLDGTVISVGGKDSTKHIRLLGPDGADEYKLSTRNVELAKQLGSYLFSLVRVTGVGTWYRNEDGQWELDNFLVQNCEPIEDRSLIEAVASLRSIEGSEWEGLDDPFGAWQNLRRN